MVSFGASVETFASAEDYLAALHPAGVSCLIVDVHLAAKSGLDLLARLSVTGDRPPVIVITAHDDAATREEARRYGASAFLCKPFESTTLLSAVGDALGRTPGVGDS